MVNKKYREKVSSVEQNNLQKVDGVRSRAIIMQLFAAILWSFGGLLIKVSVTVKGFKLYF
jgi:hypothetical protein